MIKKAVLFIEKSFKYLLLLLFFLSCENKPSNKEKINLGDGNFLVPGSLNKDGCREYHFFNENGLPTNQMIYYVDKELNILDSYNKSKCI